MVILDPHQKPPEDFRLFFKQLQKATADELQNRLSIVDAHSLQGRIAPGFEKVASVNTSRVTLGSPKPGANHADVLESPLLPGLQFVPGLLAADVQLDLISRLLHRDLADPRHLSNVHKHYYIPYEAILGSKDPKYHSNNSSENETKDSSFFNLPPNTSTLLHPLDPTIHKALTFDQFLSKKLRWLTLGGQYDWTRKEYPHSEPPAFPKDVGHLIQAAFPELTPEAAIVNVYSPGDILSLHRDVSEASSQGLASISLGCEAIFVVGLQDVAGTRCVAIRLRSGDAVYMSGPSRYAWHGVPRIIADSCPSWLCAWPAAADQPGTNAACPTRFEAWRNWLATKRINLNVRQMFDSEQC